MAHNHLGHNWYSYDLEENIADWILECLSECIDFVQPYDTMYLRAKRTLNGRKIFKIVFAGEFQTDEGREYNFPICYLLDLNTGKFKGNKMHYCIDSNGTHYSDRYPVYCDRFKFSPGSKYFRERKQLRTFLESLEIPDAVPSSKERRYIAKCARKRRMQGQTQTQTSPWRVGYGGRKKKKGILLVDPIVT